MKITAEARSDQWNADDFIAGPRTFTIKDVHPGKATQKYDIELVEGEGKVWRPPLTVLRILLAAWGDESDLWRGRRVMLARDADVVYGGQKVGGIRIKAMSHIQRPITLRLQKRRGEKQEHHIEPLTEPVEPAPTPPPVTDEQILAATTVDELRALWLTADPIQRKAIEQRVADLEPEAAR